MSIFYKDENLNVNFEEVRELLIKSFGGRFIDKKEDIEKAFKGSSHVIYTYDDFKLIGVARAISDIEWAVIYNIAVDPDYQGKGIGKETVKRLINSLGKRHIFLYTHPRTISFYEHLGFKRTKMAFKYVSEDNKEIIDKLEHVGFFLPNGFRFENEVDNKTINKREVKKEININLKRDLKNVSFDELNNLLEKAFNHKRDKEKTEIEFKGSNFVSLAYLDNKLIGCARLVTDNFKEAILLNVSVLPEYQGYGIASKIINDLSNQANGYDIFIHANPKSYSFYNTHSCFKRYKTAFAYISDIEPDNNDFFLPNGYRHPDEFYNEDIKYFKGKILN